MAARELELFDGRKIVDDGPESIITQLMGMRLGAEESREQYRVRTASLAMELYGIKLDPLSDDSLVSTMITNGMLRFVDQP